MRTLIKETPELVGKEVELAGWVDVRRDHGKIIFIDLRDRSGIMQLVFTPHQVSKETGADLPSTSFAKIKPGAGFTPASKGIYENAQKLRGEWVIKVKGTVKARPKSMENPNIPTGKVEMEAASLEILSEAVTPPIATSGDGLDINEEIRMQYRYIDLRRERMQKNMWLRHKVRQLAREYLDKNGFIEIETPTLTKSSPEGARDFLVPSRLQPGKFYALPQAPQQYKQLLMISGFERYYQIAHCLRDEDLRGDRQFEHTQIDLEMAFAAEKDVRDTVEGMMIHIVELCGKKIQDKPFPVFTHEEAMKKFGADKFDLRKDKNDPNTFAFAWVIDFPLFEKDKETGKLTFAHNPFSAPKKEHVRDLLAEKDLETLRAQQYDLVCNGCEVASGGGRISDPKVQRKVFEIMGLTKEQTEERFGHLIHAYEYGAPPHAGAAPGLDRLVMLLANEKNIREVIAFPINANGNTSVMSAPSEVDEKQLAELHLKIQKDGES